MSSICQAAVADGGECRWTKEQVFVENRRKRKDSTFLWQLVSLQIFTKYQRISKTLRTAVHHKEKLGTFETIRINCAGSPYNSPALYLSFPEKSESEKVGVIQDETGQRLTAEEN